jgi:hypothetical protein
MMSPSDRLHGSYIPPPDGWVQAEFMQRPASGIATSDRILWIKDGRKDRLERREDLNIKLGTVK